MHRSHSIAPDDHTHIRSDLENAPEIATELGHVCVAWAAIEFRIFAFFVRLTGMSPPIARACFYSHFNAKSRFNLLLSVATMLFSQSDKPLPELDELDKILAAINKTAQKRNKYIHDPWGAWDKQINSVFQVQLGGRELLGRGQNVKKNDLAQLTAQLQKHGDALYELYDRVRPLLPPLQEKLAQLQGLDLVFARTDIPPGIRPKGPKFPRQSSASKPSAKQRRQNALQVK